MHQLSYIIRGFLMKLHFDAIIIVHEHWEDAMSDMLRIKNVEQMRELLRLGPLKHQNILLVDYRDAMEMNQIGDMTFTSDLYAVSFKNMDCGITYGRQSYDFGEGSLLFTGPDQLISFQSQEEAADGWLLMMHPDLFLKSDLSQRIKEYTFFSYDLSEALHLSDKEKGLINNIIGELKEELKNEADNYSEEVLISSIDLLLNYAKRFYGRQFITRKTANTGVVAKFEALLNEKITVEVLENHGAPTVKGLAEELGYSANYLSDLLKKETGKNTQDHIQTRILEKSKTMLLTSTETVTEIAYKLGFSYPAHFSAFFKNKMGLSPAKYRKTNA